MLPMVPWFSTLSIYQNHLKGLLDGRLLTSIPWFDSVGFNADSEISFQDSRWCCYWSRGISAQWKVLGSHPDLLYQLSASSSILFVCFNQKNSPAKGSHLLRKLQEYYSLHYPPNTHTLPPQCDGYLWWIPQGSFCALHLFCGAIQAPRLSTGLKLNHTFSSFFPVSFCFLHSPSPESMPSIRWAQECSSQPLLPHNENSVIALVVLWLLGSI